MGYVPKFIYFDRPIILDYPIGMYWSQDYIRQCVAAIYNSFKTDMDEGTKIALVVMGTSGAMIAGAILSMLYNISPDTKGYILIVRKDNETAHCPSLRGIRDVEPAKFIVVDDFIDSGDTINAIIGKLDEYFNGEYHPVKKYDMLCISNPITVKALKKNYCGQYRLWKWICSRFKYVVCSPNYKVT